jgi:hypothetical protein
MNGSGGEVYPYSAITQARLIPELDLDSVRRLSSLYFFFS